MSSYNYASTSSSPVSSFFPTGPASPHAFSSFHQSPRDTHAMFAAFSSSGQHSGQRSGHSSAGSALKKTVMTAPVVDDITDASAIFPAHTHLSPTSASAMLPHFVPDTTSAAST
ncbi:hypothetical protein WOLCODRAFT_148314 [Wolfiporia cocos MD-104 SS10]|uniref:Uncharacterized protein n=1 Tax=Wolfiporia cocos (strain MD-104) TaxID=742152 RepID=A0A2H3IWZ5_WOLCO|nr:hypothetical protein WOLCODRAFT_148314 [Wolfiporia cocos MD-104 SS10]